MNEPIETRAELYRELGIWKLRIILPEWVFEDIIRDGDTGRLPMVVGLKVAQAWSSVHHSNLISDEQLVAMVKFELINRKKDNE